MNSSAHDYPVPSAWGRTVVVCPARPIQALKATTMDAGKVPMLSLDDDPSWESGYVAPLAQYLNQINVMGSNDTCANNCASVQNALNMLTSRGEHPGSSTASVSSRATRTRPTRRTAAQRRSTCRLCTCSRRSAPGVTPTARGACWATDLIWSACLLGDRVGLDAVPRGEEQRAA